jgi:hypothetical protein
MFPIRLDQLMTKEEFDEEMKNMTPEDAQKLRDKFSTPN